MAACKPFHEHLVKGRYVALAGPHASVASSAERALLLVPVHSSGWPGEVASRVADVLQAEVETVRGASASDATVVHTLLPGKEGPVDRFVALAVPAAALRTGYGPALLRGELPSASVRPCTAVPRLLFYDIVSNAVVRVASADELHDGGCGGDGGVTAALAAVAAARLPFFGAGVRTLCEVGVPLAPVADEALAAVAEAAAAAAGGIRDAAPAAPSLKQAVGGLLGVWAFAAPSERPLRAVPVRPVPALTGPPVPEQLRHWARVRLSDPGMLCGVKDVNERTTCLNTLFQRDSHERAGGVLLAEYCSTLFRPPIIFGYESVPRQCRAAEPLTVNQRNEICQQIVSIAYASDRVAQSEACGLQVRETVDLHGNVIVAAYQTRSATGEPPLLLARCTSRMYPGVQRRKAHLECFKKALSALQIPPCTRRWPSKAMTVTEGAEAAKLRDVEKRCAAWYRFAHDELAADAVTRGIYVDELQQQPESAAPASPPAPAPVPQADAGGPPPTAAQPPSRRGPLKSLILSLISNPGCICYVEAADARSELADLIERADANGKPFDGDVLADYCTHVLRPPALCGFPASFTKLRPTRSCDRATEGKCKGMLAHSVQQLTVALEALKEWDPRARRLRIREELRPAKGDSAHVSVGVSVFVDEKEIASASFATASSATGRRAVFKKALRDAADALNINLPPGGKPGSRGAHLSRLWALDKFFKEVYRFGPAPSRKRERSYSDEGFSPPSAKYSRTTADGNGEERGGGGGRRGASPPRSAEKRRFDDSWDGGDEPTRRAPPPPSHDAAARLARPPTAVPSRPTSGGEPQQQRPPPPPPPRNAPPPPPPLSSRAPPAGGAPPPLPSTPPPPQGKPMSRPGSVAATAAKETRAGGVAGQQASLVAVKVEAASAASAAAAPPPLPPTPPSARGRGVSPREPRRSLTSSVGETEKSEICRSARSPVLSVAAFTSPTACARAAVSSARRPGGASGEPLPPATTSNSPAPSSPCVKTHALRPDSTSSTIGRPTSSYTAALSWITPSTLCHSPLPLPLQHTSAPLLRPRTWHDFPKSQTMLRSAVSRGWSCWLAMFFFYLFLQQLLYFIFSFIRKKSHLFSFLLPPPPRPRR
eukprot:Rhum_TRINITY_DN14635_c10_g1::Rhum_TRINITY_DN14635_c10_g1_i1::g.105803::m.105803